MKYYKIKKFTAETKKVNLEDETLIKTAREFLSLTSEQQTKFSLGGNLYKLRLAAKEGKGKSAGARSILTYKHNDQIFWLHFFSKNEKSNVTDSELKKLKQLSKILCELSEHQISKLLSMKELYEVNEDV